MVCIGFKELKNPVTGRFFGFNFTCYSDIFSLSFQSIAHTPHFASLLKKFWPKKFLLCWFNPY